MSSSIFFRFKSRKDAQQINFDGTSLSVFEVKREIMTISRLGDGKDFDLEIFTNDLTEKYDDDTTQIPRSTTVVVSRAPSSRPGAGRAARYVSGQMPIHARNNHIKSNSTGAPTISGNAAEMTEEEKLKAVLNASEHQLKADLQNSSGRPVQHRHTHKSSAVPDKPLPPGYMCHRCGKGGHWIQACPTNEDPNFDGKHKFKRTTGIPKSFHVALDTEHAIGEDGQVDPTKLGKGAMYTSDGKWVRTKTDDVAWQKFQDQQAAAAEKAKQAEQGSQELRDRGLECSIDNQPFVNPHKTPCCGTTYCFTCIDDTLAENGLTCPSCGDNPVLMDNLIKDDETAKKLEDFNAEKKKEKVVKDKEASQSPGAGTPGTAPTYARSPSAAPQVKGDGPDSPSSTSSSSKKRKADDELDNKRRPSNPAEMKHSPTKQVTPHPPKGPASQSATPQPPTGPKAMAQPQNMNSFVNQMNSMPSMTTGMNAFANPMMNPMMMGMNGMMPGMMQPNYNTMMMGGMGGMPGMNMNMNMGMNGMHGMNGGYGMHGTYGYQNVQNQQQPWMRKGGGGVPTGPAAGGDDGPYQRTAVNPHRHQGRQKRPRSVDYKQM